MLFCFLGLGGCETATPLVTLDTVGPEPAGVHPAGSPQGYLKVYSATGEFNDGDLMYYPHSRYSIYLGNGTRYKRVENHTTPGDENPQLVTLPAGTYYVLAQSDLNGLVKVPVIIKGGQTTVVNLQRGGLGHFPVDS